MTTPNQPPVQDAPNPPPAMERAEYLVDQLGAKLGQWADTAGNRLQRLWARTREEGEDIWAEAQDLRRRNGVGIGPAGRPPGEAGSATLAEPPHAEPETRPRSRKPKKTADAASG